MTALTLREIAEFARTHEVTPTERRAQRVSLMMGLRSKKSNLTREEASSLLDNIEGHKNTISKEQKDK